MKPSTLLPAIAFVAPALASGGGGVSINEVRIDQSGNDDDEYFELAGPANTSLDGMFYIVLGDGTGGSGVVESITDLTGSSIGASGYFVCAESTFTIGTADLTATLDFENSDNVTHMLVADFTGASQDDLDTDDDGVLDVTPWSSIIDCIGLVETVGSGEFIYCSDTVGPDGTFVPSHAYDCPSMGGFQIGSFDAGVADTPGADNPCTPPPVVASINEIRIDQGGDDNDEYLELAGTPGDPLDGLTYIVIGDGAGGSGVVEGIADLTGGVIPASGLFVAAEATFSLGVADMTITLDFENSDNVTHMLVRDFTGVSQDDLDTDDDGILDVTPWSEVVDCVGLVETVGSGDLLYCTTTVGPDGSFVPAHVYYCAALGGWQIGDFGLGVDDTPGADNDCAPDGEFESYCVSFPNSVSVDGAQIGQTGSGNLSDNDTVLEVTDCPDDYGLFFFSASEDLVIPFGNGALCVGQPFVRWPVSKAAGNMNSLTLDFTGAGPESAFTVGETTYIQYWYRDKGQGAGNNTSDALKATWGN
ncbi:MAG: hypothetical protein O2816_12380 [Planctomycetota bacterium]|nr:hypothetical protein [Planctomycetota bacterium]